MSDLPRSVSTVVVGGGILGTAAAHFLADRGESDVLVLERGVLGSGSSGRGLGEMRHQLDGELALRLSQLASEFWREFAAFTGSAHDFRKRGSVILSTTAAGDARLRAGAVLAGRLGLDVEMLDRDAIRDLVPGLYVDDVAGARYCAADGYGDPAQALSGFASAAILEGVRFVERCPASQVLVEDGRVSGVRTALGEVSCERVLLAAGVGAAALAATAGVTLPVSSRPAGVLETRPIPALAGMPVVVEEESGLRLRPNGNAIRIGLPALGEQHTIEGWVRERAARRHPLLANLAIASTWTYEVVTTPDGRALLGRVAGARGLYVATGWGDEGFMLAPAIGQLVVESMLDGASTVDVGPFAPTRFATAR